jgi:tetratricopeptide (TPR) repeat protein
MEIAETIEKARAFRRDDELEESQELLLELLEEYPDDPLVLFELGGAYDVMGLEIEAIPYYERAIDQGLEGPELLECYICLGLNHRAIGEFEDAVEILENATSQYPEDNSAKTFLALAYYSNEQYAESVQLLVGLLVQTTDDEQITAYADTLDYYKDNLDEVWEEDDYEEDDE